jgi:succinate dehydrogenase hydrophobic anchor subunit
MELKPKGNSATSPASRSLLEIAEHFANIANHALIVITTFYITWYSFFAGFKDNLTVHAWFSTVGYQFFMSEGILALYSNDIYSTPVRERRIKKRVHWILQAIGGSMAIFGVVFEIYIREAANKKHFKSDHSLTGKLLIIYGCLNMQFCILRSRFGDFSYPHNCIRLPCAIRNGTEAILEAIVL